MAAEAGGEEAAAAVAAAAGERVEEAERAAAAMEAREGDVAWQGARGVCSATGSSRVSGSGGRHGAFLRQSL